MNNQIEELMKTYRKLIENKNNAGRVISRERYVASEKIIQVILIINIKGKCCIMKLI